MKSVNQSLPAGLMGKNLEVFAQGEKLYTLYNGIQMLFDDLPEEIKEVFLRELLKDKTAINALIKINITDQDAALRQYVWCNYGGWNRIPDFDGKTLSSEYWDCGSRGVCPFEGKICKAINHEGEIITPRELEIIKLIADGLADKEIASLLNIAYFTVTKHRQNIERKLSARSKVDVAVWAAKNNISCSPCK